MFIINIFMINIFIKIFFKSTKIAATTENYVSTVNLSFF